MVTSSRTLSYIALCVSTFCLLGYSECLFAVPFYRLKASAFSSGQAPLEKLQKSILQKDSNLQYRVLWDRREFLLDKAHMLLSFEVSDRILVSQRAELKESPVLESKTLTQLNKGKRLRVIKSQQLWIQIETQGDHGRVKGWIPSQNVMNDEADSGFYRSMIETPLREKPNDFGKRLDVIPRLSPLRPISIDGAWAKIQFNQKTGYVNTRYLLSKYDFATKVMTAAGEWRSVHSHDGDHLIVTDAKFKKETISVDEIIKMKTDDDRAFVVANLDEQSSVIDPPKLGSRVSIIEKRGEFWFLSQLEGHGKVWWSEKKEVDQSPTLTHDELTNKKFINISVIETDSTIGLATTSSGVYRTLDGQNWKKMSEFQNNTFPVLAHPDGVLFVGPYRSLDKGETFEPFIRWDRVAVMIKERYHYDPKFYKITKLETLPGSKVKVVLDVGLYKIKLVSYVRGAEVRILK